MDRKTQEDAWRHEQVFVDGHRLAVAISESSDQMPLVVFLHGIMSSVNFWPSILPQEFLSRFRCISLSLPGHSPSKLPPTFRPSDVTPDLFAKLVAVAVEQVAGTSSFHLVGWSTGGFAALATASEPQISDRVLSVTSINGFARGTWGSWLGLLEHLAAWWIHRASFYASLWVLRTYPSALYLFLRLFTGSFWSREIRERLYASSLYSEINQHEPRSLRKVMGGLRFVNMTNRLADIRCPVLVIGGLSDSVIRPKEARHIASHISGAKLEELPKVGHMFFAEALPAVLELMDSMIRKCEQQSRISP